MSHPTASLRASHITGGSQSQAPSAAALARLSEKKKEYDAVCALDRASAMFVKRIEGLSADCDVMADAGIGDTFWPHFICRLLVLMARGYDRSPRPGSRAVAPDVQDPGDFL